MCCVGVGAGGGGGRGRGGGGRGGEGGWGVILLCVVSKRGPLAGSFGILGWDYVKRVLLFGIMGLECECGKGREGSGGRLVGHVLFKEWAGGGGGGCFV